MFLVVFSEYLEEIKKFGCLNFKEFCGTRKKMIIKKIFFFKLYIYHITHGINTIVKFCIFFFIKLCSSIIVKFVLHNYHHIWHNALPPRSGLQKFPQFIRSFATTL